MGLLRTAIATLVSKVEKRTPVRLDEMPPIFTHPQALRLSGGKKAAAQNDGEREEEEETREEFS